MAAGSTGTVGATGPHSAGHAIYSAENLREDSETLNAQPAYTLMEIVSDVTSAIMFMQCFTRPNLAKTDHASLSSCTAPSMPRALSCWSTRPQSWGQIPSLEYLLATVLQTCSDCSVFIRIFW